MLGACPKGTKVRYCKPNSYYPEIVGAHGELIEDYNGSNVFVGWKITSEPAKTKFPGWATVCNSAPSELELLEEPTVPISVPCIPKYKYAAYQIEKDGSVALCSTGNYCETKAAMRAQIETWVRQNSKSYVLLEAVEICGPTLPPIEWVDARPPSDLPVDLPPEKKNA